MLTFAMVTSRARSAETLPSGVGRLWFSRRSRDVSELIGIWLWKIRKLGHLRMPSRATKWTRSRRKAVYAMTVETMVYPYQLDVSVGSHETTKCFWSVLGPGRSQRQSWAYRSFPWSTARGNWSQSLRESITTDPKQEQAAPGEGRVGLDKRVGVPIRHSKAAFDWCWCRLGMVILFRGRTGF